MPNLYKIFRDLIPTAPLLVGEVIAFDNGTATIQLPDGGTVLGRGSATVGDKVFVRDGLIEGPAPLLSDEIIEV